MLLNFTKKWKSFFFSGELYRFVFGMILRFSLKKAVGKTIAFHRIRKRCRCLCYQAYNFLLYYKIATFTIDSNTNNWSHVNHGNLRIDKSFSNAVYIIYCFFHRKTFYALKKNVKRLLLSNFLPDTFHKIDNSWGSGKWILSNAKSNRKSILEMLLTSEVSLDIFLSIHHFLRFYCLTHECTFSMILPYALSTWIR